MSGLSILFEVGMKSMPGKHYNGAKQMKNLSYFIFSIIFLAVGKIAISQKPACSDSLMVHQADSIKQAFSRNGFIVVKEASMTMESDFEIPVIVPLTESTLYQFVFIGDASSKSYEVKMFDWNEKQVAYQKKQWGDSDSNVISYAYTPKSSEYHMIKPLQVSASKKNLCGYVMLLKKIKEYVISYAYTPKSSEYHMIKPLQVSASKKNLCGYVMLLKKIKE